MRRNYPEKSQILPHFSTLSAFILLLGLAWSGFPAHAAEESTTQAQTQAQKGSELSPGSVASLPNPPRDSTKHFVQFMKSERKEDDKYLEQRFDRATSLLHNKDLTQEKEIRAFLMTPREKFCRSWNLGRAYDHAFLDIRHGVTISGPYLVGRMTSALDVQPGDKVLEIGTGSGYQSAMLTYLTDQVYTIEIIDVLEKETDALYTDLASAGYPEYGKIKRKADDGYYGWEEHAPFDKIIVTCGIDHIPPPLLKQLKMGGFMVIPVGPPGAQVILKVSKSQDAQGNPVITREDIYHGRKKEAFVPFTKQGGGTHYNEGR
jgi:protein-L-isoaspartate(D-aspartate) O-methyltransferase